MNIYLSRIARVCILVSFLLTGTSAWAETCEAVYPSVLQSNSATGTLGVDSGAMVINAPSTVLPFVGGTINANDGDSCGSADCSVSGASASSLSLATFPSISGGSSYDGGSEIFGEGLYNTDTFNNITLNSGTSSFSDNYTEYFIQTLIIQTGSTLNLKPGTYWVETLNVNSGANKIQVVGTGTVYLMVKNAFNLSSNAEISGFTSTAALSLTGYSGMNLNSNSTMSGIIYINGDVIINNGAILTGALSSNSLQLNTNSTVEYVDGLFSTYDYSETCSSPVSAQQLAFYGFEDITWSGNSTILDSSGVDNHGVVIGTALTQDPSEQVSCRVLDIPENTSDTEYDAIDTGIDMNDVGNKGTISFWYRSDEDWASGNERVLFDASDAIDSDGSGPKYFFLSINTAGSLFFALEDEGDKDNQITTNAYAFSADEWVHIAATWDLSTNSYEIYVNGELATIAINFNTIANSNFGELDTLYIGDNRSTYSSSGNSANGQFDDFRLYNYLQSGADIIIDSETVTTCVYEPVGFYQFEQDAWSGAGDVLDSSDSANHGDPLGSISPFLDSTTQKSCQALEIGNNTSSSVISAVDTGIDINSLGDDGTISFWYRSNNPWSGGGNRQLIDASTRSAGDKYFFLVLRSNGSLRFGLEYSDDDDLYSTTSNYSFAADEWVHIAITWNPLAAELELYVNGSKATTTDSIETPEGDTLDEMGTLFIGDNSTSYAVNGSTSNSANGYFDDVRVYSFIQNEEQINSDAEALSPCDIEPVAFYQFEQESWSSSGDVLDSTPNGNNGSPVNSNVSSVLASDQIACRYLDVPQNTSDSVFDAIDTEVKASTLGNTGSISFWYKSNEEWDSGNVRQLVDASTRGAANSDPNKHFFLVLTASGDLQFSLEDKNDRHLTAETVTSFSFAADTWVHVAVTWNLPNETMQIVVNGAQQSLIYDNSSSLDDEISDTATIYLGDNRSDYFQFSSSGNSANGQFDELRLYNSEQAVSQISEDMNDRDSCKVIDHYRIEHLGQGLTCEAAPISIKACANEDCSTLFDESVSISLLPSGWNGGDTLTFTEQLATSLSITTLSNITFSQTSSVPDAPLRCFYGAEETCDIEFVDTGFKFIGASENDSAQSDHVAETNFSNVQIQAIEKNTSTGACQAALGDPQEVVLSYQCISPNECLTEFAGIAISDPTGLNSETRELSFNDDGIASLGLLFYADAGQIQLTVQATVGGATLKGESNFDVYPSYLKPNVENANIIYGDSGEQNNYVAGEDFTFSIGAYGANDNLLPNYLPGNVQPGNLQLKVSRLRPQGSGTDGLFQYSTIGSRSSNLSAAFSNTADLDFVAGEYVTANAYYSEVGRIEIDVQDEDYLGNQINSDNPLVLGDFHPAFFKVEVTETPVLANTCGVFSYIGQEIGFSTDPELTITAYNAREIAEITQNYSFNSITEDSYWNYSPDQDLLESSLSFIDSSDYTITGTVSPISHGDTPVIGSNDGYSGSGTITITNASFQYDKVDTDDNAYSVVAPFDALINLLFSSDFFSVDFIGKGGTNNACFKDDNADSICNELSINGVIGAELRYGRLVLESTYGPETEPLNVPIKAEYYDSGQWLVNTADSCTSIAFTKTSGQIQLQGIDDYDTDLVGDVESVGELMSGLPVGDQFTLNPPGERGQLELYLDPAALDIEWPDHLNYNWNHANEEDDNTIDSDDFPKATVTFGQFRGNDRIIHWREVFN